jgi:protein-tyrosine phosphatase
MKRKRKHYKLNEFREVTFHGELVDHKFNQYMENLEAEEDELIEMAELEQQILYGTPDPQGRKPVGFIDGAKSTRPLKLDRNI